MDRDKGNPWRVKGKSMKGKGKSWDFSTLEPFIPLKKICYVISTKYATISYLYKNLYNYRLPDAC